MQQPERIAILSRGDERGDMRVLEAQDVAGFDIRRVFWFSGNGDPALTRGHHAHRALTQFMVCLEGAFSVTLDRMDEPRTHRLEASGSGLLVPPGWWAVLHDFTPDARVMVFCSDPYDESDYMRERAEFAAWLKERATGEIEFYPMRRALEAERVMLQSTFARVLDSGVLIGGDVLTEFESAFATYCGADHVIGCGNGLDALALILAAYGIGPGDEVIVPANSFIASALAATMVGATPVLADARPGTYGLDPDAFARAITPRTRAVIPVHLYGIPCDMDAIVQIAKPRDIKVIEDAAQAQGARYGGRRTGTLGDAAGFSFYPTKNLGALGDAGAVATNDSALAARVRALGNYGSARKYIHDVAGRNSRLDPVHAAVLAARLKNLDAQNAIRAQHAAVYSELLAGRDDIVLPALPDGVESVWHLMPVLVAAAKRDALIAHLAAHGITALIHYPVPIHKQKAYAALCAGQNFPIAEDTAARLVSLPLTPWHTPEEIRRVAQTVKDFLDGAR
ncbi:MAG: DegT/DnrJ/EryC1/StrS family aminotransferase [Rhodospirillales bacterium]|nr:DegT/DnrJ/EryC1/StrS family aminotransferase [Alphaproteobacteria bacterium]MCB9986832.1 DegT/DnrJ/EryC1/StrS family aminotransferase [Rhodospirillales bacterium]USO08404.1 MAG: DegT/DnrJ/EryC1/StrS family aminotransferase [Rhodospirillales bacterium]